MNLGPIQLLRPEAVAEKFGVDRCDLPRLVKAGRIPAPVIIGRRSKRWIESAVDDCLRRNLKRITPADPEPVCKHPQKDEPTCLYRHYSQSGELLYVGIALSPIERLSGHRAASPWFRRISRVEIQRYPDRVTAMRAERKAIQTEKPTHNKMMVIR